MEPEHVHDADRRESHPEEVRTLGHDGADEQSAVRAALDRQPVLRGVPFADQVLRRGDEIVENILLVEEHARPVPGFSVLPSPAERRMGVDAAVLEQDDDGRIEGRLHADVEPAVGGQVGRTRAVERQALAVDDEHRNPGSILARVEDFLGFVVLGTETDLASAEYFGHARGDVVLENGRRIGERREGVKNGRVVPPAPEPAGRSELRERDIPDERPVEGVLTELRVGVLEIAAEELSPGRAGRGQDLGLLGNDVFPLCRRGIGRIDQDDPVVRGADVGVDQEFRPDVVHDAAVAVESRDENLEFRVLVRERFPADFVPRSALGEVEEGIGQVLADVQSLVDQGMLGVLIDQHILFLGVAELVEKDLLEFVLGREFLARDRLVVAAVEESVLDPGRPR